MVVSGFVAEGFEPVQRAFEESFASNGEVGAAFAATRDGKPVVDLWGGIADTASSTPWREDTLQVVFSGTKGFVALCMLILIERGQLALDQPVARYWPEFDAAGKDGVLVRHAVSHEAGLPGFRAPVSHERTGRRSKNGCPSRRPGTVLAPWRARLLPRRDVRLALR